MELPGAGWNFHVVIIGKGALNGTPPIFIKISESPVGNLPAYIDKVDVNSSRTNCRYCPLHIRNSSIVDPFIKAEFTLYEVLFFIRANNTDDTTTHYFTNLPGYTAYCTSRARHDQRFAGSWLAYI